MSPRKRKPGNEWLAQYPGLHVNDYGVFYVKHPVTKKKGSLQTKDRTTAIRRWTLINERWEEERSDWATKALADRLVSLSTPKSEGDNIHLSDYLKRWRTQVLGHHVVKGRVEWKECIVLAQRGKRIGQPIAMPTRIDYANDARQLEEQDAARFPMSAPDIVRRIRKLLAPWLDKPTHYNGLRNTLSRVMSYAVQQGIVDRNPVIDITKASAKKRLVLIPDEAYTAITENLSVHKLNKREFDGTWRAKICDLIYMMSQQPIDVFGIQDKQAEIFSNPRTVTAKDERGAVLESYDVHGILKIRRHKTDVGIELEMNEELADLIAWFRNFKKEQGIISEHLLVYPMYFDVRSRARPVRHRFMQGAWREASVEAGYGHTYQLRDLRKKGLTNEFLEQGENDKGGHETEEMRRHYRLITPPKRARSTLKYITKKA